MKKGLDYPGVAIVYFCHDGKGRFLLNLRNQNARDEQGRWDCGGGALEHGEEVIEAMKREIKEEYMTDVLDFKFLGYRDVHREQNGQKTHWIALDYKVLVNAELAGNGEPHKFDQVKWFEWHEFPENLHSQFPVFLKHYQDRLK